MLTVSNCLCQYASDCGLYIFWYWSWCSNKKQYLTLSWRRSLSCRNQSIKQSVNSSLLSEMFYAVMWKTYHEAFALKKFRFWQEDLLAATKFFFLLRFFVENHRSVNKKCYINPCRTTGVFLWPMETWENQVLVNLTLSSERRC